MVYTAWYIPSIYLVYTLYIQCIYKTRSYAPARACGGRYAWFCGAGPGTARRRLTRVETDQIEPDNHGPSRQNAAPVRVSHGHGKQEASLNSESALHGLDTTQEGPPRPPETRGHVTATARVTTVEQHSLGTTCTALTGFGTRPKGWLRKPVSWPSKGW